MTEYLVFPTDDVRESDVAIVIADSDEEALQIYRAAYLPDEDYFRESVLDEIFETEISFGMPSDPQPLPEATIRQNAGKWADVVIHQDFDTWPRALFEDFARDNDRYIYLVAVKLSDIKRTRNSSEE